MRRNIDFYPLVQLQYLDINITPNKLAYEIYPIDIIREHSTLHGAITSICEEINKKSHVHKTRPQ